MATNDGALPWQESDSERFIELGRVYTPRRAELADALLGMLPAAADAAFSAVELGTGAGWLADELLRRFPRARLIGLDGSETMLRAAGQLLAQHGGRAELRPFRLEDAAWRAALDPGSLRFAYSCLVVHHLDAAGKLALYRDLFERLEPGGALVIADMVAPAGEFERRYVARLYDAEVRRQSIAYTGDERAWQAFDRDQWNIFEHPDPMDLPATLAEHVRWLNEAGFVNVSAPWVWAGHAVYGGYRPA